MSTKRDREQVEKLSPVELQAAAVSLKTTLNGLMMRRRVGQLTDVAGVWRVRKQLARVLTRLGTKDLTTGRSR